MASITYDPKTGIPENSDHYYNYDLKRLRTSEVYLEFFCKNLLIYSLIIIMFGFVHQLELNLYAADSIP